MTVRKLIESLIWHEMDAEVYMPDWNEEYCNPTVVSGVRSACAEDWHEGEEGDQMPEGFCNGVILQPG